MGPLSAMWCAPKEWPQANSARTATARRLMEFAPLMYGSLSLLLRLRLRRGHGRRRRLVATVQQFVECLLVHQQAGLAVPIGPGRQDVLHQQRLRQYGIESVAAAGDRHRHGARRVRQITDTLPVNLLVVLGNLGA